MKEKKLNCWEFMRCGREMGGHNKEIGVCPTAVAKNLHGTHGGTHAGRACWVVAGTMCGGKAQGSFAQKYRNCEQCTFFQAVKKEEGAKFQLALVLISKLSGQPKAVQPPVLPESPTLYPERN